MCVFRPIHVVVRIAVVRREPERTKASGFTLIEILVVVAIIALLVSILMPTLRHAREQGRSVVCQTQLRELFEGSTYYAHTYDNRLPYFGWYSPPDSGDQWWITQLARLLNNSFDLYTCPSDKEPYSVKVVIESGTLRMADINTQRAVPMDVTYRSACESLETYTLDERDARYVPGKKKGGYRPRRIASWKRPGYALLLMEANMNVEAWGRECFRLRQHAWNMLVDQQAYPDEVKWRVYGVTGRPPREITAWEHYAYSSAGQELLKTLERHNGWSNFMFLDGHVQAHKPLEALEIALRQEYKDNKGQRSGGFGEPEP